MARKNVVPSFRMIDAADMSSSITSEIVNVLNMDKASVHLYWTGNAGSSTVTVEARNGSDDSWYELDLGVVIVLSTATGDEQLLFIELPFTDIRVLATASGGGELSATITMKQVGG